MDRRVAIVGVGVTPFRTHAEKEWKQLVCEALYEALNDANMSASEIQVGYVGCSLPNIIDQVPVGTLVAEYTGLNPLGLSSNAEQCSSGQLAIQNAFFAIRSGLYDKAVAIGFDQMSNAVDLRRLTEPSLDVSEVRVTRFSASSLHVVLWYKLHFRAHGEPSREQVAKYAVYARKMAKKNPKAYFYDRPEITVDDVLNAHLVATPLGNLDHTNFFVDGAGAVVLTRGDVAKQYTDTPVFIEGVSHKNDHVSKWVDPNFMFMPALRVAAREAYSMAGIEARDVHFACLHDCWAFFAPVELEALGICADKEGGKFIEDGQVELGGRCPCATDGGIYGRGHPPAASGMAHAFEAVTQLRGEAGDRQVEGAENAVLVMIGDSARDVSIYRRE